VTEFLSSNFKKSKWIFWSADNGGKGFVKSPFVRSLNKEHCKVEKISQEQGIKYFGTGAETSSNQSSNWTAASS